MAALVAGPADAGAKLMPRPGGIATAYLAGTKSRRPRSAAVASSASPSLPASFGFRSFLDAARVRSGFSGAFRDNVRELLRDCGELQEYTVLRRMPVWRTLLVDDKTGAVVPLFYVEESVRHSERSPYCEFCRCSGWSHHFISRRRYHFIIPPEDCWDQPFQSDYFDQQSNILHGLIHCNGFGHLLCINGREGGSKFISGRDTMDLWDRICHVLRARQVTVEDSARRGSMELRLLIGVAYGVTWFGRWGYRFHLGSFAVTKHDYHKALDELAFQDLEALIDEFGQSRVPREENRELQRIIHAARWRNPRICTVRQLICHFLDMQRDARRSPSPAQRYYAAADTDYSRYRSAARRNPSSSTKGDRTGKSKKRAVRDFDDIAAELESRWSVRRLRGAAQVVVDALFEHGGVLTRQDVRDAARKTIGDTGLLDFVLKSLGDCIVGRHVVRRTQNPLTRVLEFSLEKPPPDGSDSSVVQSGTVSSPIPIDDVALPQQREPVVVEKDETEEEFGERTPRMVPLKSSVTQAEKDLVWLYKHVLMRGKAGDTVLHSKRWVKLWPMRDDEDDQLRFLCRWIPGDDDMMSGNLLNRPLPPPEVLVMPIHSAVIDLKEEAQRAMRDTYCIMERFTVTRLDGVAGQDWDPLFGGAESGATVWVRGEGVDLTTTNFNNASTANSSQQLRYEGGIESWTVECGCGATDDDGERMVACDVCESWQHTRCAGIADGESVPKLFLCARCAAASSSTADMDSIPHAGWLIDVDDFKVCYDLPSDPYASTIDQVDLEYGLVDWNPTWR